MKHIINNKDYSNEVGSLSSFAQKRLGFSKMPKILFDDDVPNSQKTLGKTGYYDPSSSEIHIYASGRHIKDILRSVAHELVHHMQNEKGDLTHDGYMGQGYAQKNPKMREMERQAYEMGNLCFRDWEDGLKEKHPTIYNERRNRKMSLKDWKNKELNENLNKRWGFSMNLNNLNEARDSSSDAAAAFDRKAEKELAGKIAKAGLKTAKEVNDKFGDWIKDNIQPPRDGSVTKALKMAKEMKEGIGAGPMDPMGGQSSMEMAPPMEPGEMGCMEVDPATGECLDEMPQAGSSPCAAAEPMGIARDPEMPFQEAKDNVEENLDNLKGGLKDYMKGRSSKNDDSSDDNGDKEEESSDKEESKDGKIPMKTDTKDADNDGDTKDKVPTFVKESLNRTIRVRIKK